MKIMILGAGQIGLFLAERLAIEKHQITIIDENIELIEQLKQKYKIQGFVGSGSNIDLLLQAGLRETELVLALTGTDEVNILACSIASKASVKTKIARVRANWINHRHIFAIEDLDIDLIINPEIEACNYILKILSNPGLFEINEFTKEKLQIRGYRIKEVNDIVNRPFKTFAKDERLNKTLILGILRKDVIIIPTGEDDLQLGDKVFVLGTQSDLEGIHHLFSHVKGRFNRVFLVGASKISDILIPKLNENDFHIKFMDNDLHKCKQFAEKFPYITVVRGNPTQSTVLLEESIRDFDAFISVSDNEEINFISCMIAKNHGIHKAIPFIHRNDFFTLANLAGIDTIISPGLSAVNKILRFVRKGNVLSVTSMMDKKAEMLEIIVTNKSRLVNQRLSEVHLPKNTLVAAVIRDKEIIIPRGTTMIFENDRIMIFALSNAIRKLDAFI